jgi:probable phosphoglycerate mutase
MSEIIAHIDGGSRGNPGPAAYGVSIETTQGQPVAAFGRFLGKATNNFAEYQGLLAALDYALSHGYPRLRVLTDSELMARQISGQYKVRSLDLKPLHAQAQAMIARLESFSIRHVYREQNREADRLANRAMDEAEGGRGRTALAPQPSPPPRRASTDSPNPPQSLVVRATYQDGILRPHRPVALLEGEEVEVEIRRKK